MWFREQMWFARDGRKVYLRHSDSPALYELPLSKSWVRVSSRAQGPDCDVPGRISWVSQSFPRGRPFSDEQRETHTSKLAT